jgi:hypothetical protein
MNHLKEIIGRAYKYHGSCQTTFIVKAINGHTIEFECGHKVTDAVFSDMWDVEARNYNYALLNWPIF